MAEILNSYLRINASYFKEIKAFKPLLKFVSEELLPNFYRYDQYICISKYTKIINNKLGFCLKHIEPYKVSL